MIVGITPGRQQALEALRVARTALAEGKNDETALSEAKVAASFAGPMRRNLVRLMDFLGIADALGMESTADLWGPRQDLVHFTSALRNPVFADGSNYSGQGIDGSRFLQAQIDQWFVEEVRQLPSALFLRLGPAATSACVRLCRRGSMRESQILPGLPHPSGANAERISYVLGQKPRGELSAKTNPAVIDVGRERAFRCADQWRRSG